MSERAPSAPGISPPHPRRREPTAEAFDALPGRAYPALASPEFGLSMGLVIGRFAVGMNDLHYGYWEPDLAVTLANLPRAQARYTELLIEDIPAGVHAVLDVGCGTGETARRLLRAGYAVDGVSPNPFLDREAERVFRGPSTMFRSRFEALATDRRYDLILFSESFLFLQPGPALAKTRELLRPGGYLLISDLFKLPAGEPSPIGGGTDLAAHRARMAASPFTLLRDTDLTEQIAPTFDLLQRAYDQAIEPAYRLVLARLDAFHPWWMRAARLVFGRELRRWEAKHLSGKRDGAHFRRHKSYRRLLYELTASAAPAQSARPRD